MKRVWAISLLGALVVTGCAAGGNRQSARPIAPPPRPPQGSPRVDVPLDAALRQRAKEQVLASARSSDTVTRCQAIEAAQIGLGLEGSETILAGLRDPRALVRFAGALAAGGLQLEPARARLVELAEDPDSRVRIAALYALHRLGDTTRSHDLEQLAVHPDPNVRRNTVMVLGLLGEKSAVRVLWPLQKDMDPAVRLQVSEALWRLGNDTGLQTLVAFSLSDAPDDMIIATLGLAAPLDTRVRGHVRAKLTTVYDEVNLAAARAMGMLGSDEGYGVAEKGAASTDPRQRAMAALALGAIGRPDAQNLLDKLLADKSESVRLAAALGILQLNLPVAGR